jgi:hypothetical protein
MISAIDAGVPFLGLCADMPPDLERVGMFAELGWDLLQFPCRFESVAEFESALCGLEMMFVRAFQRLHGREIATMNVWTKDQDECRAKTDWIWAQRDRRRAAQVAPRPGSKSWQPKGPVRRPAPYLLVWEDCWLKRWCVTDRKVYNAKRFRISLSYSGKECPITVCTRRSDAQGPGSSLRQPGKATPSMGGSACEHALQMEVWASTPSSRSA